MPKTTASNPKPKMAKIAMSLPPAIVADLDYLSSRLGFSRSALAAELLAEPLTEMRTVIALIPPNPTPSDLLRARGASQDIIRQRLENATRLSDDLFGTPEDDQ
jgi:hypothetical protein